jgi:hypothetical protein
MPDFATTIAGLPTLKDVTPETRTGLTQRVVMDLVGRHRWPFLLKVQQEFAWAANATIRSFPGVARIWNIMIPDAGDDYYRLVEQSDVEFQKWIELNPGETTPRIWRDAGMAGDEYQIEMYAEPSSAKTLKIDYTEMPNADNVDTLPGRFQSLVMLGVQAYAHPEVPFLLRNYETAIVEAIAREQDLQGKRWRTGMDPVQAARWRHVNAPS